MPPDSVDQEFGQATAGMASLCSTMSEAGKLKGWELESSEGSFIMAVVAGYWLRRLPSFPHGSLLVISPNRLFELPYVGYLGLLEHAFQKERARLKLHPFSDISLEIT